MKIYWTVIYVFNLQTVFRLKTGEDDMLTRVIKLSIIILKEIVVIILSNITWYSKVDARYQSYSGNKFGSTTQ